MEQVLIPPNNGADHNHILMNSPPPYNFNSKSEHFFSSTDQRLFSPLYVPTNGGDFLSGYPFAPSVPSSPLTNFPNSGDGEVLSPTTPDHHRLQLARLAVQYQEVADRYTLCLNHLADAAKEAEELRLKNAELLIANGDLVSRLAATAAERANRKQQQSAAAAAAMANGIRRLRVADVVPTMPPSAPTLTVADKRAVLPKSISVRSKGYLKTNNQQPSSAAPGQNGGIRVLSPVNVGWQQKVHVGEDSKKEAGKKEAGAGAGSPGADLEFDVYNQGMFKTELCNKWEETGKCPYGQQCQFAHGIEELRPVIRHPRYKTQICKMVLAGDACPYGHRCHFRHSIAPSDRLFLRA